MKTKILTVVIILITTIIIALCGWMISIQIPEERTSYNGEMTIAKIDHSRTATRSGVWDHYIAVVSNDCDNIVVSISAEQFAKYQIGDEVIITGYKNTFSDGTVTFSDVRIKERR